MTTRRNFLKWSALSAAMLSVNKSFAKNNSVNGSGSKPIVISTWKHGIEANADAWKILSSGGRALDAVEKGVMNSESDLNNRSVGLGGLPDRDGHVTLDACIMDEKGNCGSVCFIEHIKHPVSVARMVMEKTPHIILVGEGALKFALDNGFTKEKFDRTPEADKAWKDWLKKSEYKPIINFENHDTIGMIALDASGNLSGSCTTSGLSYKLHGRVGDSPIIGAGLFVDNEVGAATATGTGEEVIRIAGTHTVVEMMRAGHTPEEACRIAVERVSKSPKNVREMQIGFLALNKHGEFGGFALQKGFNFAVYSSEIKNEMRDAKHLW
ncbi:MAG TPA: N(4)-(beta-N-acetylglucosaminyl)-L-asparaginase [Bacteroidia bacterium]|nr:N(4)-(beta-N-acetylglucosaminyl)-L-asparaginase [Bacteroidia bacterium]